MSVWQEPKTNWKNSDYFNLSPDYQRIKGDIEYLHALALKLYSPFSIYTLGTYTIQEFPKADFFNNIVYDIDLINQNTLGSSNARYKTMKTYSSNGRIWSYDDLNIIEGNLAMLYNELQIKRYNNKPRLSFTLGAKKF